MTFHGMLLYQAVLVVFFFFFMVVWLFFFFFISVQIFPVVTSTCFT